MAQVVTVPVVLFNIFFPLGHFEHNFDDALLFYDAISYITRTYKLRHKYQKRGERREKIEERREKREENVFSALATRTV